MKFLGRKMIVGFIIVLLCFLVSFVIMFTMTTGAYSSVYDKLQENIVENVLKRNPDQKYVINICLRKKVIDEAEIKENYNIYFDHGLEYLKAYKARIRANEIEGISFQLNFYRGRIRDGIRCRTCDKKYAF